MPSPRRAISLLLPVGAFDPCVDLCESARENILGRLESDRVAFHKGGVPRDGTIGIGRIPEDGAPLFGWRIIRKSDLVTESRRPSPRSRTGSPTRAMGCLLSSIPVITHLR